MEESKPVFKDYLVIKVDSRDSRADKSVEICVLTTRGNMLARHSRLYLRKGVHHKGINIWKKVPGLRRYKTEKMANVKAGKLNNIFETTGFQAIREDKI